MRKTHLLIVVGVVCGPLAALALSMSDNIEKDKTGIIVLPGATPDQVAPASTLASDSITAETTPSGPMSSPATTTAATATAAAAGPPTSGYTLVYSDEFNDGALNEADWYHRILKEKRENGYATAANVSLASGSLRLKYSRQDVTGDSAPDYVGSGVISRNLFGYGYYETRAKLFQGTLGVHTSFWSLGLRRGFSSQGVDPDIEADMDAEKIPEFNEILEIDGFEHQSREYMNGGTITHVKIRDTQRYSLTENQLGIRWDEWNTYGYEYTPDSIRFYVNGSLIFTSYINAADNLYNPMQFWLTALPLPEGIQGIDNSQLPGYSFFNYFRFYRKSYPGANLLGNGNFDATSSTTDTPSSLEAPPSWIESYDKDRSNLVFDQPHEGTRLLLHSGTSPYHVSTKQNLQFLPNGTYTLTAWVKSSGGQTRAEMRVLNFGGTEIAKAIPAGNSWIQLTIPNIQVTQNKATIAFTSEANANQWIRVDGVKLSLN